MMDRYRNTKLTAKTVIWVIALTILYLSFYPYNEWWGVTVTLLYVSFAFILPILIYFEEIDKSADTGEVDSTRTIGE
jgi:predicted MFS family arabinose efflux permease